MKNSTRTHFATLALIACTGLASLLACGGGSPTAPSSPFLVDITNIWFEEGNAAHEFNLIPDRQGRVSFSTFSGDESTPEGDFFVLSGSYEERSIQFTILRDTGDVTFTGTFVDENRISVSAGSESLVIIR